MGILLIWWSYPRIDKDLFIYLFKRPASKAVCVMLCNGGVEDVTHFLLHCKVLAPCRERFVRSLAVSLKSAGLPGRIVLQRVQQGGDACLGVMLGGTTEWSCLAGLDEASFRANCGKANWLACTSAKNFLVAAWRVREAVVGRVKIQGSALLMEPSPRTYFFFFFFFFCMSRHPDVTNYMTTYV